LLVVPEFYLFSRSLSARSARGLGRRKRASCVKRAEEGEDEERGTAKDKRDGESDDDDDEELRTA